MRGRVVVIGGGAAGVFAAIQCAELNPQLEVSLLEAGRQLLSKVKISGGGRCNVTHHCFEPATLIQSYPRGGQALRGAFTRFQPQDTIAWFARRGVKLKTEADGRMFPVTDDSQTIVDCLIQSALQAKVQLRTGTAVKGVTKINDRFSLELNTLEILRGDRLLIATGSHPSGHRFAQRLGHQIQPLVPSLFTFTIRDSRLEGLAGLSVPQATLSLNLPKSKLVQTGPLLITHWGLSGPAVLKLSAWGAKILFDHHYQMSLLINWLPGEHPDSLKEKLIKLKTEIPKKQVNSFSPIDLPKRLWQRFLEVSDVPAKTLWSELPNSKIQQLSQEITQGRFQIQAKGAFKEEFVTCGGVSLKEVNFKTMESKICPGLYFAGEVLDIDGVTGGFNFQSAWTTGWLAGQALAEG
ncbi:NAD(P)/FAD-dependent oxidoreductase [Gloeocapsa sp. PCC 73106]|uniref:NAD(P)/FAD-dependent oxidoreductase n=1 Tax=Gloeocapsa sp. PCC 73106 TaxID=102232 RepID=UPI0002AC5159|nr:NAD(P)/FAD-dependent oxidoreductase [Gloeocapsa sp. PCC 73106]ELR98290.1 flavoprotein, HI0933 family [Gloeocapsa sp. PCC 73106]